VPKLCVLVILASFLKDTAMKRRLIGFLLALALAILVAPLTANAQHARKIPHVGVLSPYSSSRPFSPGQEVFQHVLRDLGLHGGTDHRV
jgi:hypothetical protein